MRVGVLTGTGTYTLPGAGEGSLERVITWETSSTEGPL